MVTNSWAESIGVEDSWVTDGKVELVVQYVPLVCTSPPSEQLFGRDKLSACKLQELANKDNVTQSTLDGSH